MGAAKAAMVAHCAAHAADVAVRPLPGAVDLVRALAARSDVALGLVTGNLQDIGVQKLASCGMAAAFACGGFGSDHVHRGELILVAAARARALYPRLRLPKHLLGEANVAVEASASAAAAGRLAEPEDPVRVWHCGDTLYDLAAAAYAGVNCVGVATGGASFASLSAFGSPGAPPVRLSGAASESEAHALALAPSVVLAASAATGKRVIVRDFSDLGAVLETLGLPALPAAPPAAGAAARGPI